MLNCSVGVNIKGTYRVEKVYQDGLSDADSPGSHTYCTVYRQRLNSISTDLGRANGSHEPLDRTSGAFSCRGQLAPSMLVVAAFK